MCSQSKVLGEGSLWKGGYVAKSTGGGQKVNLLKEELTTGAYEPDQLILFVDRLVRKVSPFIGYSCFTFLFEILRNE